MDAYTKRGKWRGVHQCVGVCRCVRAQACDRCEARTVGRWAEHAVAVAKIVRVNEKKRPSPSPAAPEKERAPQPVLIGAGIAVVQAIAVIIFGIVLIIRDVTDAKNESMVSDAAASGWVGTGTAIFLFIVFGFVIFGAVAMIKGKRWGRGAIVLVQFILAASSFQMMSGGAIALGVLVLLSAAVTLWLLMLVPASTQWAASHY